MFMIPKPRIGLLLVAALVVISLLANPAAPQAHAEYKTVTYSFNESNALGSGVWGTVKIEAYDGVGTGGGGLSAGQVRFTVDAPYIYGPLPVPSNYGLQLFAFNTDLAPPPTDILVTDSSLTDLSWTIQYDNNVNGFGTFSVLNHGDGNSRASPIIVTLSNLGTDATLEHFLFLSDINQNQTPAYFAAHLGGIPGELPSHHIAVTNLNPEPSAMVLALMGVAGVGLGGWRRFRRQAR